MKYMPFCACFLQRTASLLLSGDGGGSAGKIDQIHPGEIGGGEPCRRGSADGRGGQHPGVGAVKCRTDGGGGDGR